MKELLKVLWIDSIKKGTYLVCTNKSAIANIEEQLKRNSAFTIKEEQDLVEQVFKDYHITIGHPHIYYQKLRMLFSACLNQSEDELVAMKNYSYSLRNMLTHSDYKPAIKALDKPSLQLTESDRFIQYVLEHINPEATAYELDNYRLLYSFIKTTTNANRFMLSKISDQETADNISQLLDAIKGANETAELLKERTFVKESSTEAVLQDEARKSNKAQMERLLKDRKLVEWLRQEGLFLGDVLSASSITEVHVKQVETLDNSEENTLVTVITTLVNIVKELSNELFETSVGQAVHSDPPKKQEKKVRKETKSDSHWQKKLNELQQEKESLTAQVENKTMQIQNYEKTLSDINAELYELQEENAALKSQLELFMKQPAVSENAHNLVENIQTMLLQLQQELKVETQQVFHPEDSSYNDKIKDLQVAIVGGHQKYHAQLKQEMKAGILTISPEDLNFDQKKLLKYDVIAFASGYMNHSLYEKAFDFLKKNNAKRKCLMLQTQPNAKQLAKQIYEFYHQTGNGDSS